MDEALKKSGDWPNIAITPGTHTHAATGEQIEQPENTRIGHPRGACRPDDADCGHEPADVENGAQNGSECDTREKLEAAVLGCCYSYRMPYDVVFNWLDRQAAITEREVKLRDLYKFEENHRASIDATEEVNRKLNERIVELTAERDKLKRERNIALSNYAYLQREATEEIYSLLGENDVIEVFDDNMAGKRRLVTGTQRQLENQVAELTAERDDLRSRLKTQADSFQKLERDNAKLRDTLARVRELVGGESK